MNLSCPACSKRVSWSDIDKRTQTIRCAACGAQTPLSTFFPVLKEFGLQSGPGAAFRRGDRPPPRGFVVEDLGGKLVIRRRWFGLQAFFLLFFAAFWDFVLVMFLAGIVSGQVPLPVLLFMSLHLAVGVGITYFAVCSFVNHTVIELDGDQLSVRSKPLPWPGVRVDLRAGDLTQLYSRQVQTRTKNGYSTSYSLLALLREGGEVKLLKGLSDPEQALFCEYQLEQRMGIRDEPVPDELPRAAEASHRE